MGIKIYSGESEPVDELLFLETPLFQRWVRKNRLALAVEKLKREIITNPESGAVIPGGSGLRKVRMAGGGRGKRGGFRVVTDCSCSVPSQCY